MTATVRAGVLDVAYEAHGPEQGTPVVLLHGFPYDVHAYDEVAPDLAGHGCRVLVPYLRGYGPTRFVSRHTPRSGQQAALGHDLLAFLDALGISRALLAGYDWGGRAAGILAALWPQRVAALVIADGYPIQDIAAASQPADPQAEWRYWYQYYFHSERGRAGLAANRQALCRLLWELWSPTWRFDAATFERSAAAFDNPDFVEVVIHSYRHRYGLAEGDPAYEDSERALQAQPRIEVPTTVLAGGDDGVSSLRGGALEAAHFGAAYHYEAIADCGHNIPQEQPQAFAGAILQRLGLA